MANPKPVIGQLSTLSSLLTPSENHTDTRIGLEQCVRIRSDIVTVINAKRKFVHVTPSFCKMIGYTEDELIGKPYDEVTVPGTNHIPITWQIFLNTGYNFGIWVFAHKTGTKLFVRFEAFARDDGLYETHMELLAAGA